jgi:hypothetical protein
MLSRHGSRYPTVGSDVFELGKRIAAAAGTFRAKGPLSFLNDWSYQLGHEILVPKGWLADWLCVSAMLLLLLSRLRRPRGSSSAPC